MVAWGVWYTGQAAYRRRRSKGECSPTMWSMWKRSRAGTGRSSAGDDASPAQPLNIGSILRQARELTGDDIRACARHLRIREPYLRAIEDGRFEDLPGRAYAVGFVRTYAIHLGLDGDKVVERFKTESQDQEAAPELVVPEPTAESGMPGKSLLAASVVLAALAYGGWYYLSAQTRLVAEAPAIDLPTRPAPVNPQFAQRQAAPAAKSQQTQPVSAPVPRPSTMPPAQAILSPGQQLAALPRSDAEPGVPAAASEDADEAEVEAEAETPPAPEPLAPNTVTAALQPAPAPAPDAAARDAVARPPISPSAASAIASPVTGPQAPSRPSRVVIRAIADSWLQVGDGRSPALFAQVLRAGDSYHVPERAGLKLDTGNAGGIEITVDGRPVPSVGPSGSVRRNIPLDADKLVAGAFGQR